VDLAQDLVAAVAAVAVVADRARAEDLALW
jgi:hypothetical protein